MLTEDEAEVTAQRTFGLGDDVGSEKVWIQRETANPKSALGAVDVRRTGYSQLILPIIVLANVNHRHHAMQRVNEDPFWLCRG